MIYKNKVWTMQYKLDPPKKQLMEENFGASER